MNLTFRLARASDAPAIAALRNAAADDLTARFGKGDWSTQSSERSVASAMRRARVLVARSDRRLVAVLTLATKKPWAIYPEYFTPCKRPLYLTGMAVAPELQRRGVGRRMLREARRVALAWPTDAIRLDAYDARAGAGPFYAKCGFEFRGRAVYRNTPHVYYELCLR